MKHLIFTLAIILLTCFIKLDNCIGQWVQSGLESANVYTLEVSGTNLFAGTLGGGVFRSTNNGNNWNALNSGLTNSNVIYFTVKDENIFAGTRGGGVFRSTNNGENWTATGLTSGDVYAMAVNSDYLFAGLTWGGGVLRSTNNGDNWTTVNNGLYNGNVLHLVVSGTYLFAGTQGGGVFRSSNDGTNWISVNSGLTNLNIRTLAIKDGNIFAGTYASINGGVFLSTNNGESWTAINNGFSSSDVREFAISDGDIHAGTGAGVFFSLNNGQSWIQRNQGFNNDPEVQTVLSAGDYMYAGTSNQGVWRRLKNTFGKTRWYVSKTGNDSATGTIIDPLRTIQRGINLSENYDTVLVGQGTYYENIIINGKKITLTSNYLTTNDTSIISRTIIDGSWTGTTVEINNISDTAFSLVGFTIQNGKTLISANDYPKLKRLVVQHSGPSLMPLSGITGRSFIMEDCIVQNINVCQPVSLWLSPQYIIRRSIFRNNKSLIGPVINTNAVRTGLIENSLFYNNDNITIGYAGISNGLNIVNSTLISNTFANMIYTANSWGGASIISIKNSILNNNYQYQIFGDQAQLINIENSIITGGINSIRKSTSTVVNYFPTNIDANPKFADTLSYNYKLSDFSPAIGTGTVTGAPLVDILGNPRPNPVGSNPDIGAYENPRANRIPLITGDANADTTVNVLDVTSIVNYILGNLTPIFYFEAADVNQDTLINVLDVVGVINIIMNPGYDVFAGNNENDNSGSGSLSLQNNSLMLSSTVPVSALQFRISGNNASGVTFAFNSILNPFQVIGGNQGDTSRTYIIFSMNNSLIPGGLHNLGTFSGLSSGMILRDVIIADSLGSNIVTGTGNEFPTELPKEYSLSQNYPNPFNPRTTISFQLPKSGMTKLNVYDVTGRLIKTLVNEFRSAGYYEEVFDAGKYASGVYIYRLEAGNYSSSRKMIIIK